MKRFAIALASTMIAAVLATPALAQQADPNVTGVITQGNKTIVFERGTSGLKLDELGAFNKVVADDPSLATKLARNPKLVQSDAFVGKHPALKQYLEQYPSARDDIAENPGNYLTPVKGSAWTHAEPDGNIGN